MPKTPDEIKKGLECCTSRDCGGSKCPYFNEKSCNAAKSADALALIQQLEEQCKHMNDLRDAAAERALKMEERVHQLEAERDAAVEDMKQAAIYLCCACKKYHPAVRGVSHHYCEVIGERDDFTGAISCGMFEWRGVQKEE